MNQTQYARQEKMEHAALCFKRYILTHSAGFPQEPMMDLYRINLLGMMLNRYEELTTRGLSELAAIQRTEQEFADIRQRMIDAGFEADAFGTAHAKKWPEVMEYEATQYIRERSAMIRRRSLGIALCVASAASLFLGVAMFDIWPLLLWMMAGLSGMLGMIAAGVYMMVTAQKPADGEKIRGGYFSLSSRMREKLLRMKEAEEEKARRRAGKGVALIITSLIPLFVGFVFLGVGSRILLPVLCVDGMLAMIAAGVYQLCVGSGEKQTMNMLLRSER